jgi:predicted amino acid-binding ACT domain protein
MTSLRLRVELADRPGIFAAATTALAALGVDLLAIDVLEENGPTVVDELVVRTPPGVSAQDVEDVLRMAGAIEVLSVAVGGPVEDPVVRAIGYALAVLSSPWDADAAGRALASLAYADAGVMLDVGDAARFPLGRRALETGIPATGRAGPDASPLAVPTGWVLWVAQDGPDPAAMAVVARRLNVRFSAAEAARLRAFATLLARTGVAAAY